jgi:hypothetical protein
MLFLTVSMRTINLAHSRSISTQNEKKKKDSDRFGIAQSKKETKNIPSLDLPVQPFQATWHMLQHAQLQSLDLWKSHGG